VLTWRFLGAATFVSIAAAFFDASDSSTDRAMAICNSLRHRLYGAIKEVTDYVREEFNRAEALANDKRGGTVGFALTILQRRLASSPEAIYQSLHRRSERLQKRLRELELLQRGAAAEAINIGSPALDAEDVEDLEDAPDDEVEAVEEEILDPATAAHTIGELKAEIATLGRLETFALGVRRQTGM